MATYTTYNFPTHENGSTFPGVQFNLTVNAVAKTPTVIDMEVAGKHFTLAGGHFAITDVGAFQFKEQEVTLPDGLHDYIIKVTVDGKKKSYIRGTWLITDN